MKRIIKNNYKIIIGILIGILLSVTSVYAIDAYIESNKVSYDNKSTKKDNVQEAIDELYERSGIHQEKWADPILNGADPVLKSPLIPVTIDNDGNVYYANEKSEWYNYSEKRWANAVILIDEPSNPNYGVGDHIIEDDIESYFVWIPRYQYKIWNMGDFKEVLDVKNLQDIESTINESFYKLFDRISIIDIKFGSVDKIVKMNESEAVVGEYYTHPAFTLGNKDLNGFWMGKFETGYKGATKSTAAQVDGEEKDSVVIKPNVYSWRSITLNNAFFTSYNYERELDSHMLKNTEWGAVAYLSNSIYGIEGKININNNYDYKTGYSAAANTNQNIYPGDTGKSDEPTKTMPWDTPTGYLASTTGNISGVYDMSGGAIEYVAAYAKDTQDYSNLTSSDYQTYADYFNVYSSEGLIILNKHRILGDATGEMGPFYVFYDKGGIRRIHNIWYYGSSDFDPSWARFAARGASADGGLLSNQFSLNCWSGELRNIIGFRIAITAS